MCWSFGAFLPADLVLAIFGDEKKKEEDEGEKDGVLFKTQRVREIDVK